MKVSKLMTKELVTVGADATIGEVMGVLADHECRHVPLVDDHQVIGVIGERDVRWIEGLLVRAIGDPIGSETVFSQKARELVPGEPVSIRQNASIDDAIDRMVETRVGTLVVLDDDDDLIGMLSYIDVLAAARGRFGK